MATILTVRLLIASGSSSSGCEVETNHSGTGRGMLLKGVNRGSPEKSRIPSGAVCRVPSDNARSQ